MRTIAALAGTMLLATVLPAGPGPAAAEKSVDLLYTTCSNGRLENCRCPNDPYGAMEKRAAEVQRHRELGPLLLLDSGDFFPAMVDTLTARAVIEIYQLMEYDAVTLGDQELMHGPELLAEVTARLPVVSANLVHRDGGAVAPPSRTLRRGGQTWFITAVTHPEALRFISPDQVGHLRVLDPDSSLEAVVASAPEGAKVIVLSHSGMQRDEKQVPRWEGVDLVVAGHDQTVQRGVRMVEGTPVVSAGGSGRYLGVARFGPGGLRAELVPLEPGMPDDPRVMSIVMEVQRAKMSGASP